MVGCVQNMLNSDASHKYAVINTPPTSLAISPRHPRFSDVDLAFLCFLSHFVIV
jgi:hypothetical protein